MKPKGSSLRISIKSMSLVRLTKKENIYEYRIIILYMLTSNRQPDIPQQMDSFGNHKEPQPETRDHGWWATWRWLKR